MREERDPNEDPDLWTVDCDDPEDAWRDRSIITVDQVLEDFFTIERGRARGRRLERLESAIDDLRMCLEVLASRVLTTGDLQARDLEREVAPRYPVARVATAYSLLAELPVWLEEERWWGADLEDRRLRLQLALPLARHVARQPVEGYSNGWGSGFWSVEAAVQQARWRLRAARAALRD